MLVCEVKRVFPLYMFQIVRRILVLDYTCCRQSKWLTHKVGAIYSILLCTVQPVHKTTLRILRFITERAKKYMELALF